LLNQLLAAIGFGSFAWFAALSVAVTAVRPRGGERGLRMADAQSGLGIMVFTRHRIDRRIQSTAWARAERPVPYRRDDAARSALAAHSGIARRVDLSDW